MRVAPPFDPTPVRRGELRPLHYAILGLLAEAPAHGYRLRAAFSAGGDLGAVLRVEAPTLYAALKELLALGAIEGVERRVGARPPRTEFRLTDEGRARFEEWLTRPAQRLREVRLDFLLRLYFARRRDPAVAAELVHRQAEALERYVAAVEAWAQTAPPASWLGLVAESRLVAARATLAWLQELAGVAHGTHQPGVGG